MKIKTTKTDRLFSQLVRFLANGECERCHRTGRLETAHFHSRRKRSVRWDRQNVAALCSGCHRYLDSEPLEKVEFFRRKMSLKEFNALNKRAESLVKVDVKAIEEDLKQKIKSIT